MHVTCAVSTGEYTFIQYIVLSMQGSSAKLTKWHYHVCMHPVG